MPAPPRNTAAGLHHIWVNATGNWAYFVDDLDRIDWLRRFVAVLDRYGWSAVAVCQMTTHVHAIVHVPDESLPRGMHRLNLGYSIAFNVRHGRAGQFVRKRFGSRRIEDGRDLVGTYAYVVLNPVREGMCPRAEDWRWSSYATAIELSTDFEFVDPSLVIAELGSIAALRAYVAERGDEVRPGHVQVTVTGTWP